MLLKPAHIRRAASIAAVFARHGLTHLVVSSGLGALLGTKPAPPDGEAKRTGEATRLGEALEELGPTFVKLGQFLSTRPDLLPPEYVAALSRLQDNTTHVPFAQIRAVVEDDLGLTLSEAFADFEETPRAAASLSQVHNAVLHSGENVAVKIQRPSIEEPIRRDLDMLHDLADWMAEHTDAGKLYDLPGVVQELDDSLRDELNYRIEAGNMRLFAGNLREFEHIRIPAVYEELSARRVLTMERVDGVKVTEFDVRGDEAHAADLARDFVEAYLKQIAIDGAVHSDPHAGNFFVSAAGDLVILDFGMVVHVDEKMRGDFVRFLISYAEGDAWHAAETLLDISTLKEDADVDGFRNEVSHIMARDQHLPPQEAMAGIVLLKMTQVAYKYRIRVPSTTTMLGKALLSMSSIAQHLDPRMDLRRITRDYMSDALLRRRITQTTPGRAFRNWGEMEQMLTYAPMRLNRILDLLSENRFQIRLVTQETEELLDGLQKIANRIAFGIIDGAIILGSALMMKYEAGPHLWGYPLLSTLGFIVSIVLGFWLIWSIVAHDRKK
jgi:predicted unusual protein kinase regulating ubiquinone biosynthesis (AarF/ABC1/UbiB family)